MLIHFRIILHSELLCCIRQPQSWLYPITFFVIVVSLFPIAFTLDQTLVEKYMPACIWIAALLASLLSIENIFYADLEAGYLEQLLLSPSSLALNVFAKLIAYWMASLLPLIVLTPLLGLFFHLAVPTVLSLCVSLLLGTPILVLLGGFVTALTIGLNQQGALLGLIFLPLMMPILIISVTLIQQSQAGLSIASPAALLAGLALFAMTLLPWVIATVLRMSVDG
ncbi:MAG: heme exporter protein CcmB [Gammaproteobacteria bacterium RIFCSPHIGHO2_12_FULL_42_10]|nr:MAG: heme exporter protein CcmB [Gammaproteobacteria bacterium RIFCSPHIGHO2_12_FULL_42_10]